MKYSGYKQLIIFTLLIGAMAPVMAQRGHNLSYGAISLMPMVDMQYLQDDNIFAADTNQIASPIQVISPRVLLSFETGVNRSALNYIGKHATYVESPTDDYLDHYLTFNMHHQFLRHFSTYVGGGFEDLHEDRGSAYSQGTALTLSEPDRYRNMRAKNEWHLGTRESTAKLELAADYLALRYTTRPGATGVRNRNDAHGRIAYHYNLSTKTSFLIEAHYRNIDYVQESAGTASRDSVEMRYLFGVSWEHSVVTEGFIKLGNQQKTFKAASRDGTSGASWEIGVDWSPSRLTTIKLSSAGKTEESVGIGEFIDSKSLSLGVDNHTTELLTLSMTGDARLNDYQPGSAKDATGTLNIRAEYQLFRWLSTGVSATHSQRRSNQAGMDFIRNVYMVHIKLGI